MPYFFVPKSGAAHIGFFQHSLTAGLILPGGAQVQKAEGMTLADLPPGAPAKVLSLEAQGALRRRLLDLGLVTGTLVSAIGRSPAGDPTAYRIRGAVMALRAEVAGQVRVLPLHTSVVSEIHLEGSHEPAKL